MPLKLHLLPASALAPSLCCLMWPAPLSTIVLPATLEALSVPLHRKNEGPASLKIIQGSGEMLDCPTLVVMPRENDT